MRDDECAAQLQLMTFMEAAQEVGVSRATVNGWITSGKLPSVHVGFRRFVRPDHLAAAQATARVGEVVPVQRADRTRVRSVTAGSPRGDGAKSAGVGGGQRPDPRSDLLLGARAERSERRKRAKNSPRPEVEPEQFVSRETVGLATMTVAEAAARLSVPADRVSAGPEWPAAGALSQPRPALVVGARDKAPYPQLRGSDRSYSGPLNRGHAAAILPYVAEKLTHLREAMRG